ncbi:Kinase-like protein [Mycena sanguinolenta]|uniref:Kinase-like protein n=1 Tax=Mycena sanguinolenta TaxID=230812 RepID=A0A8H6X3B9_9AGAR|nr:Kinase-like protein [Mycena sanguinolenta]
MRRKSENYTLNQPVPTQFVAKYASSSSRFLIYDAALSCLQNACSSQLSSRSPREVEILRMTIDDYISSMSSDTVVGAIVKNLECRKRIFQLSTELGLMNDPGFQTALYADEERIATLLVSILSSKSDEESVLRLQGDSAQHFLDVAQETLDGGFMVVPEHNRMERDEYPTFGGGFGDIYRASYGDQHVALKRMRHFLHGSDLRRIHLEFCREALVWKGLHHPYILPFLGIDRDSFPTTLCMVSPWMKHGSVINYLKTHDHANVDMLLYEIAQGLEYLHSHAIVHGDLKGANILVKENGSACLADFGLSIYSDTSAKTSSTSRGGSLYWMAPELLDPDHFGLQFVRTVATDVYAFGCVCFELYTGRPPFWGLAEPVALLKVLRAERPPGPPAMSDTLWQHVTEFWAQLPTTRPSTQSLVQKMTLGWKFSRKASKSSIQSAPPAPFITARDPSSSLLQVPVDSGAQSASSAPFVPSAPSPTTLSSMPFVNLIDLPVGTEVLSMQPNFKSEVAPLVNSEDEFGFTIPDPQLDGIVDTVKHFSHPHNATAHREDMRLLPPVFLGRDVLVQKIALLLAAQGTSRVCITGVGGMGKTSVAVAVTESSMIRNIFPKEYIFWVPCITAKSSDLLRRILYTQLRITAETYDSLDPLIAELDESQEPRLLLLDNFETPWLSGPDPLEVGHILRRLAALPHIALLVTMTSGVTPEGIEWEHIPLPALEPAAARVVFKKTYRGAAGGLELTGDETQLDNVLESIGHIPLAITLMATCGGHLGASPDDLLVDWRKAGTEMLSAGGKGRLSMNDTIGLSMERGVSSDPNAFRLLAILSMLPAGTTGENLLKWWAPTTRTSTHAAVQILRTAALIELEGDGHLPTSRIFVRPTIQSYMSHQDRIPANIREQVYDACYNFVLHHKSIPDDHKFKSDLDALASEEINIQGLLMEIPVDAPRPNAVDALIAFSLYQSWTKPSTVVASHALAVARGVYDDPCVSDRNAAARRVAAAHQSLGKSLFMLDRYHEARTHFEEAAARFKDLPGGADLHSAGEVLMELLDTWMYIGTKTPYELESLVREAQAHLSHDETDKYHVACGLLRFGAFLLWANHPDTLETLSNANAILEDLDYPASTAECLFFMARAYALRGEYNKALAFATDAMVKANHSGEVELEFDIWILIGQCHLTLGSYEKALANFKDSLALARALGAPLNIAQGLERLAYSCAAMMNLPGARVAYQGAQIQYTKIESGVTARESGKDVHTILGGSRVSQKWTTTVFSS